MNRPVLPRIATLLLAGAAALALVACGGEDDGPMMWDARSLQESVEDLPFIPSVINSGLGVGESRVVVALIDRSDGALVGDARVTATFYRLANNPDAEPEESEAFTEPTEMTARVLDLGGESGSTSAIDGHPAADSSHRSVAWVPAAAGRSAAQAHDGEDHDITTVYTSGVTFDAHGYWGLALRIEVDGKTHHARLKFWVMEHQGEVAIGAAAPRTEQLTLRDVEDAVEISSAPIPNTAMLEKTVAEALDTSRPVVVAFVTPAFCQTRFCGPVLEAVVEP
ncbi:MAG: hypothetical protein O2888_02300, partial [Chloroflexi bacterium]|nr:hypothetical protein [Chloroflexota bacterium]